MKTQPTIKPIPILFLCLLTQTILPAQDYHVRTYEFFANSFEEKYHSQIDTAAYVFEEWYKGGKLIRKFYPRFEKEYFRIETYTYNSAGKTALVHIKTWKPWLETTYLDSIIYTYENDSVYSVKITGNLVNSDNINYPIEQRYTVTGDTTLIDVLINGEYTHTSMETRESKWKISRQVIKPEISNVVNTYLYDDYGRLTEIIRTENGVSETTMRNEYVLDDQGRILIERSYLEPENWLLSTAVKIYD
jgi:hypothetical protein